MFRKKSKTIIFMLVLVTLITISNISQAFTIVLDPGHGGVDCGATNGSVHEADVTLKIAKYLKEYLMQYEGVSASLTHEGIANGELSVFDRGIMARDRNADLFVSIHVNSSSSSSANGAEIYVSANTSCDKYNKNTTELSNKILANLAKLGITNRGVKTKLLTSDKTDRYTDGTMADYYGVIRYAMRGIKIDSGVRWPVGKEPANVQNGEGVPTILIEHCFISSPKDITYINSDEAIKKVAKADADGIVQYYGLKLKTETQTPTVKVKKDDKEMTVTTIPNATIAEVVKELKATSYTILDLNGKALAKDEEKIATGYKIKIQDKTYTLVKMGDVNGDGNVLATDALAILKHSINKEKISETFIDATDVDKDGKILAADALLVLKQSIGKSTITL